MDLVLSIVKIDKSFESRVCFQLKQSKRLHSHFLTITSIFALLGIQFHNILHGNACMIATHHVPHLCHRCGNGFVVLLSHMHPLIHHYSITNPIE